MWRQHHCNYLGSFFLSWKATWKYCYVSSIICICRALGGCCLGLFCVDRVPLCPVCHWCLLKVLIMLSSCCFIPDRINFNWAFWDVWVICQQVKMIHVMMYIDNIFRILRNKHKDSNKLNLFFRTYLVYWKV